MGLLDFIFPKRCVVCSRFGSYLCLADRRKIRPAETFCPVCLKPAIGGTTHERCKTKLSLDGLICLFYYTTPVKEIIHELKYRFVRDLQAMITVEIKNSPLLKNIDFSSFTIVPIPLSRARQSWRGFNQAEILGTVLARKLKIPIDTEILKKIKETKPQAKLLRKERLRQTRGVFGSVADTSGQDIIIFDDVWTTGATIKAAAAALKRKGANRVWGLALASSH